MFITDIQQEYRYYMEGMSRQKRAESFFFNIYKVRK